MADTVESEHVVIARASAWMRRIRLLLLLLLLHRRWVGDRFAIIVIFVFIVNQRFQSMSVR